VIFLNHASGAVASLDAEMVQVGDAIWRRTECGCREPHPTSRDQAIFVDQATDASLFPNAVLLEIDRFGQ
jgi:hypothetical protein